MWVANFYGNSVTELDAATGTLVKVFTGPHYRFSQPRAITSDGTDVWVANFGDDSVSGSREEPLSWVSMRHRGLTMARG